MHTLWSVRKYNASVVGHIFAPDEVNNTANPMTNLWPMYVSYFHARISHFDSIIHYIQQANMQTIRTLNLWMIFRFYKAP